MQYPLASIAANLRIFLQAIDTSSGTQAANSEAAKNAVDADYRGVVEVLRLGYFNSSNHGSSAS